MVQLSPHTQALIKQLGGAVGGMAIAGVVYVAMGAVDLGQIQGSLVKTSDTSSSMSSSEISSAAVTDFNRRVAERAEIRKDAREATPENPAPVIYPNVQREVSQYDRIQLRTQRLQEMAAEGHGGAPLYQPVQQVVPTPEPQVIIKEVKVPVPSEPKVIIKEVKVPSEPKVIIKEVKVPVPSEPKVIIKEVPSAPQIITVEQRPTRLNDTGLGLNVLIFGATFGAALHHRRRVYVLLRRAVAFAH